MGATAKTTYKTATGFVCELVLEGASGAEVLPALTTAQQWLLEHGCTPVDPYTAGDRLAADLSRRPWLLTCVAGLPYVFAQEAQHEGLIRPDAGRTTRRRRYRRKLAAWLSKLHTLRARAWAGRSCEPGRHADSSRAMRVSAFSRPGMTRRVRIARPAPSLYKAPRTM